MTSPESFRGIIELWPTVVAFAADLRVKEVTARAWKARGFIPAEYWEEVCAVAKARGFDGVTPDALTAIVSRQREHSSAEGDAA